MLRSQFSAMYHSATSAPAPALIPPASNGCQTAARQGGLGQAGSQAGGCCLGVHTIEVVHLAGVLASAPAPTVPPSPPRSHFSLPHAYVRSQTSWQTLQNKAKKMMLTPASTPAPAYINVFPNCELLPLARFTPILAFFFGSSQTSPPSPPTTASTWKNLLRRIVSLARTRTLSLSLSCTVRMCRGCVCYMELQLYIHPVYIYTLYIYNSTI